MNWFIAFCFLAAVCVVQTITFNPLEQLRTQLERSKSEVQTIMSDLQHNRNNLEFNSKNKLSNLRTQSMTDINNIVNPALTDIRTQVDAAKAQGKDVEHCYTDARESLRTISRTGFDEIQKCGENAQQLLDTQLSSLDAAQSTGNKYINELNAVFLDCYSVNIFQMQSCAAIKLGTINSSIRTYKDTVNSLKRDAENGANKAVLAENTCNMNAVSKVRSGTTDTRIAANKCVQN